MSCDDAWWELVGAVNAHVATIEDLTRHAARYISIYPGEPELVLSRREIDLWLHFAKDAQRTVVEQGDALARYFMARSEHKSAEAPARV